MPANIYFWFYAYLLTAIAIALAFLGVRQARKGHYEAHMKSMNRAVGLIIFFVISYVFKVIFLGREDKTDWSVFYLSVLYTHEFFIGIMLFCGTYARVLAAKFKHTITMEPAGLSSEDLKRRSRHRIMGKTAILSTSLALITAAVILYGMIQRA